MSGRSARTRAVLVAAIAGGGNMIAIAAVAAITVGAIAASADARELDIAVSVGARCHDVRAADGGCLTAQTVALVGRYGEVHGSFLANYFPGAAGLIIGASFGGDVGSPFFRLAHDRLRLAVRLTLDMAVIPHKDTRIDLDWATFVVGPQLWVRVAPHAFFVARAAVGGSFFVLDVDPPFGGHGALTVSPTVDGALGMAFDLP